MKTKSKQNESCVYCGSDTYGLGYSIMNHLHNKIDGPICAKCYSEAKVEQGVRYCEICGESLSDEGLCSNSNCLNSG
jgi:predicted amidophosphoribosyltransferase